MKLPFEQALDLENFSGRVPLFPLPNVVLFPRTLLPLHIFEPRYRQMLADALQGERLMVMALLQPGWETLPAHQVPPIFPMVGLGRIIAHESLSDGRSNIVLQGLGRALVWGEERDNRPYRTGQVRLCSDHVTPEPMIDREHRKQQLLAEFCRLFPQSNIQEVFEQANSPAVSLGTVCDLLAAALPVAPVESQRLLDELDVDQRSDLLLQQIRQLARLTAQQRRPYPPPFSAN